MARRRYRRYRRRSGRWSSNLQEVGQNISAGTSTWSYPATIITNLTPSTASQAGVSQTYTIKNIEINFNLDYEGTTNTAITGIEGVTAYIMYVPEGMAVGLDYNIRHPEYIMAYKYLGSPTSEYSYELQNAIAIANGQQYQPYKVRTRLSRKLNTGDSIVLFLKGVNQTTTNITLRLSGLIRWWTKAN